MNMKTLTETSTFRVLSLLLCFCFFIPAMNVSASSLQADKFKVSGIVKMPQANRSSVPVWLKKEQPMER